MAEQLRCAERVTAQHGDGQALHARRRHKGGGVRRLAAMKIVSTNKIPEAEAIYKKVTEQNAKDAKACGALAGFYNKPNWDEAGEPWVEGSDKPRRAKFDQAIAVLEQCTNIDPNDPAGYQKVASYYWDKAYRDPLLTDEQKNTYADKGMENVDKALQLKPDYFEAVIYKGLLYRVKAGATADRRAKAEFLEKAQDLQKQGLELKKQQAAEGAAAASAAPGASGGQ
jgi:hypothetical protein